jgi:hypothetical protein
MSPPHAACAILSPDPDLRLRDSSPRPNSLDDEAITAAVDLLSLRLNQGLPMRTALSTVRQQLSHAQQAQQQLKPRVRLTAIEHQPETGWGGTSVTTAHGHTPPSELKPHGTK